MLVLNNGAPKSGSTWIQGICKEMLSPRFPSKKWRNDWANPSIEPDLLEKYYHSNEWKAFGSPVLIKTHIVYEDKFSYLLNDPGVRIVVSYRNLPDSVLSWFYHQVRLKKITVDDKERWLESGGIKYAGRLMRHRASWVGKKYVLSLRYEDLYSDPAVSVRNIADFLGADVSESRVNEVVARTQVRLAPNESPRNGRHIRTAGRSTAKEEILPAIFDKLVEMERSL